MSNRAKWNRPKPKRKESKLLIAFAIFAGFILAITLFSKVWRGLNPSEQKAGPKVLVADGTTYYACGGAMWTYNVEAHRAGEPLYEILYVDADGHQQQLHHVQTLAVRDLPADSPACRSALSAH
jgi:hypothetical protein